MKRKVYISGILGLIVLLISCKPKEDLVPVRNEVVKLRASWLTSQNHLTAVMTELKNSSRTINDAILRLEKISDSGGSHLKADAENLVSVAEEQRKEINAQMESLNLTIHEWADQSKELNKLIELISREDITIVDANKKIMELREFQTTMTPKFQAIRETIASRQEGIDKINGFVRKYE